jgi:hypothetical protein
MSTLPPDPEPSEPDPLAGLYGCMRDSVIFLPDVDLTAPTGELWRAEEADGLAQDQNPPGI